jgi:tetratricopeptide (TPR) repeat protein
MLFRDKAPPPRSEIIAEADQARARGRLKKAIAGYQKALELEPADPVVHGKLAPLLARAKQPEAALQSFQASAQGHLDKGFADKALAVYSQAADTFPLQISLWQQMAQLNLSKGRRADALKTLLRGRLRFRRKDERRGAITLLQEALALDPALFEVKLDLALQLALEKQRAEAMTLLNPMVLDARDRRQLRRLRWTMLRVSPSVGAWGRWLRASLRRDLCSSRSSGRRTAQTVDLLVRLLGRLPVDGEGELEARALPRCGVDLDRAAVGGGDLPREVEAQAQPRGLGAAHEALEEPGQQVRRHPRPLVGHGEDHPASVLPRLSRDLHHNGHPR